MTKMAPGQRLRCICVWTLVLASVLLLVFLLIPSPPATRHGANYVLLPVTRLPSHSLQFPSKKTKNNPGATLTRTINTESQAEMCRSLRYTYKVVGAQGRKDMSLPNPLAAADNYLKAEVFGDVDSFLETLPDDQNYVILVIADSFYRDMTINWMCVLYKTSAPLLGHLLVLSMDKELHTYLDNNGISSVFAQPDRLLNMTIVKCGYKRYGHVWMTRILMVHYILKQGVDVFVMDTDAFPIKDPMIMINAIAQAEDVDAIFGRGTFPPAANKAWGFTLCFGTAYFRSTPGSLHLLEAMGQVDPFYNDDQARLNTAIKTVTGVKWREQTTYDVTVGSSQSAALQFRVAVLPYSVVCRSTCSKLLRSSAADLEDLHVVHPLITKGTNKKGRIAQLGYWLLDEEKLGMESQTAVEWLTGVCTREH